MEKLKLTTVEVLALIPQSLYDVIMVCPERVEDTNTFVMNVDYL